jgi:hypothetical protein
MDFSLFECRRNGGSTSIGQSRSIGIVDILGQAENIVNGVHSEDMGIFSDNMICPPLTIGVPIMEPLDSSLEPTPLAPSSFLTKFMDRNKSHNCLDFAFSSSLPKWAANMPYKKEPQLVQSQQQLTVAQKGNPFDFPLSSLDATPFNLEDADDFEAPALVSSGSCSSSSSFSASELTLALDLAHPQQQKPKKRRVRKYKEDQWNIRYEELLQFRKEEGHVMVPHSYPKNQKLAQWVKRQRYQYRLKQTGKHCTLSPAREHMLNEAGFVWDSHKATWVDHFQDLENFASMHGHCYIPPSLAREKASLITWMKHQRRQYKRYMAGMDSTMTSERIQNLESIGFDWDPRNLALKKSL